MIAPDIRDYLAPAQNAAGQVINSVRLHCGKREVLVQISPAMSGAWQYREMAKVLQPVLDRVFAEGQRSMAGAQHAGTSGKSS